MAQVTRAIVIASTVLAAFAETYLATWHSPPYVLWLSIGSFIAAAAIGWRARSIALPIVLSLLYLMPAILIALGVNENLSFDFYWLMPLTGVVLSGPGVQRWSLPSRWQWPLVTYAAIVAVSWPIVFMRETDFALRVLAMNPANSSAGFSPLDTNLHVSYLAIANLLAVLWVDALCRWYREDRERFIRDVIYPLAVTATIGSAVAIYQGFVDMTFLNRGFWTYMLRVAGTHGDPNKLGAVAAFWAIGTVVLARRFTSPWAALVGAAAILIGIGAVWTSGSRTGLAALLVGLAAAAVEAVRATRFDLRRALLASGAVLILGAGVVIALQQASTHTIVQRGTLGYLPFYGDKGIVRSANELFWERMGYGLAANQMVEEHPLAGVGIGTFHTLVRDFGRLRGYEGQQALTPDNAQQWFRHTVAELGVLGAVPAVFWCVLLAMLMFGRRDRERDRLPFGLIRGALLGFLVASIFGFPAQTAAVLLTFWTFVFWLLLERGGHGRGAGSSDPAIATAMSAGRRWSAPAAIAAAVLIAVHAGATIADARGDLWPRNRSVRFGWFYKYGMSELEPDPGGNPVQRRWTIMPTSLAVVPVHGKVLKFVAWIDHPDGDERPVQTKVWADGTLVFDGEIRRSAPLFLDIPATPGRTHLILETEIDRLWAPRDYGMSDRRGLGLSVRDWVWE
jgi:hypothetical protein